MLVCLLYFHQLQAYLYPSQKLTLSGIKLRTPYKRHAQALLPTWGVIKGRCTLNRQYLDLGSWRCWIACQFDTNRDEGSNCTGVGASCGGCCSLLGPREGWLQLL